MLLTPSVNSVIQAAPKVNFRRSPPNPLHLDPADIFLKSILKGQRAVDGTEGGIRRHLTRQVSRGDSPAGTASPDLAALQRRLDAIESVLEIKNSTSSAGVGVEGEPGTDTGTPKL